MGGRRVAASAYVKYFDDIVTTMRAVPGTHFTFERNPTRGDLVVGALAQYYPGTTTSTTSASTSTTWSSSFIPERRPSSRHMTTQSDGLNWLAAFAKSHHKAIVLPEWGLGWGTRSASGQPISAPGQQVCGGDDGPWVNLMATWIADHHVLEATYWDFGT